MASLARLQSTVKAAGRRAGQRRAPSCSRVFHPRGLRSPYPSNFINVIEAQPAQELRHGAVGRRDTLGILLLSGCGGEGRSERE